jgi:hypothetical protein
MESTMIDFERKWEKRTEETEKRPRLGREKERRSESGKEKVGK